MRFCFLININLKIQGLFFEIIESLYHAGEKLPTCSGSYTDKFRI